MKIFTKQDLEKLVYYMQVLNAMFCHEGMIFINIINHAIMSSDAERASVPASIAESFN